MKTKVLKIEIALLHTDWNDAKELETPRQRHEVCNEIGYWISKFVEENVPLTHACSLVLGQKTISIDEMNCAAENKGKNLIQHLTRKWRH